jgi:ankyrin repeat protein
LLAQEEIEVNKLTQKGTALHMACSLNKPAYVLMLLSKNADPSIMNSEGYIPADLCNSEEIIKIMNKATINKENTIINPNNDVYCF